MSTITDNRERWVSKREVAEHFGFATRTVNRWLAAGCPSRVMSNVRRFRISEVDAWLAEQADRADAA
jgi:predicted DNA-binding transcriptional regulator AlpA